MSIHCQSAFIVKCDYCHRELTKFHASVNDAVMDALGRATIRIDCQFESDCAWECYECAARRSLVQTVREGCLNLVELK